MDQQVHFRRLQEWAKLVLEAENSGNKTAWCKENGITYRRYQYWQKLVRDYILKHGEDSLTMNGSALPVRTEPQQLVDITSCVKESAEEGKPSADFSQNEAIQPQLMLRYGDFRIYVGSSVSEDALITVLKAVRNA